MMAGCLEFSAVPVDDDIVVLALANAEIVSFVSVIGLRVLADVLTEYYYKNFKTNETSNLFADERIVACLQF